MTENSFATLMARWNPVDVASFAPQLASQAMRPNEQMGGGSPLYQRETAATTPQSFVPSPTAASVDRTYRGPATVPNSDVTLEAINKTRPPGKGFTLDDINQILRNLGGGSGPAY